jgi:hypothetical protein
MILCQNCLTGHADGTRYCDVCGTRLDGDAPDGRKTAIPAPGSPGSESNSKLVTPSLQTSDALHPLPVAPESWLKPDDGAPMKAPDEIQLLPLHVRLNSGQTFELHGKPAYLIGRCDDELGSLPDLDLTAFGGIEAGVSRVHAMIHARPEGYFVEDLVSTNETLLNFFRLMPRQLYPLKDGDQLRFSLLSALIIIG